MNIKIKDNDTSKIPAAMFDSVNDPAVSIVLYGTNPNDRFNGRYEEIMSNQIRSHQDIDCVIAQASAAGYQNFRLQRYDMRDANNLLEEFAAAVNVA